MRRMLRTCGGEGRTGQMTLRILEQDEHGKTRSLWEEVFPEDTKIFLDYYYYIKTRDNQIYVIEEDEEFCSMLQLNPYIVRVEEKEFPSAYIIAVATKEKYRRRGYMGALLRASLNDMYAKKIPFTFLMPAAEAIYTPYDFRFIYSQDRGELVRSADEGQLWWNSVPCERYLQDALEESDTGRFRQHNHLKAAEIQPVEPASMTPGVGNGSVVFSDAGLWDAEEMAAFYEEHFARQYQVCTVRDSAYYQTMVMEQQSERGGVRMVKEGGVLKGIYAYAGEDGLEIREPLFLNGYEAVFLQSVNELAADGERIKVHACPPECASEAKPLIMARLVCLAEFLSALKVPEELSVDCSFAVIDTIITQNSRVWKVTSEKGETELHVRETEDSEGVLPIAELTEILFGRCMIREVKDREGVILSERLAEELEKITKLKKVCFNEIV